MVFQCINIHQVPWEVLKTAAFGLVFQHLLQDVANVNVWKTMFDPFSANFVDFIWLHCSTWAYKDSLGPDQPVQLHRPIRGGNAQSGAMLSAYTVTGYKVETLRASWKISCCMLNVVTLFK